MRKKQRVVVGLSGGVDSAVSAYLLQQQGHEVLGIFMKNWEDDDRNDDRDEADKAYCSSNIDFVDAACVADVLGIEIEHVNFAAEYKDRVFAQFLHEYQAGRTPNPDILCNAEIKFKAFLEHAFARGADAIATGHYARVRRQPSTHGYELLKGLDPGKDQSYFLHRLRQEQLARTRFPVGELHKTQVRQIAQEIGLPNARKKDSTGICFIGERPFRAFLNRYIAAKPGCIEDENARAIGEHMGLSFYTLGQRQGLGIGGVQGASQRPWYVAAKDLARNVLVVVQGHDHPWLQFRALRATDASWVAGHAPADRAQGALGYGAKTRYRQEDGPCTFASMSSSQIGDMGGEGRGDFVLSFGSPQWAVTPGQSAVLYDGEVCLGGGVIATAERFEASTTPTGQAC